jgi:hypothetical protein
MKKAVLILAALVLIASVAFGDAGIKIGAWGRGLFIPAMAGADTMAQAACSWAWNPRVGFNITGTSDNVGVSADFNFDGGGVAAGDNQKIWVKPIDMLTLTIGRFYDDTLRGSASFGMWNWLRMATMNGDGAIFSRVGEAAQKNFEISLAPVEGLYIFVSFGGILGGGSPSVLTEDMFKTGQYGAGYTIAGIGMIRAQFLGEGENAAGDMQGTIEGAFKLTAGPGLTVDLGVALPMDSDAAGYTFRAALFASYALDALTINAEGSMRMLSTDDVAFEIGVGVDYAIGGGISVGADVRYLNEFQGATKLSSATDATSEVDLDPLSATYLQNIYVPATADVYEAYPDGQIGIAIYVSMGFSNGLVGIGFEGTTGNFASVLAKDAYDDFAWALPIRLEYWF